MNKYYSLTKTDRRAEIYIFGEIVSAEETGIEKACELDLGSTSGYSLERELEGLDVDLINVYINSPGGYTSEGLAILNVLKMHKAKVVTHAMGLVCSAASVIFMAGEERKMNHASALMIHNAWLEDVEGNAAQLRKKADDLDKISAAAANAYADRVKIPRAELDALLDGENHEGSWILPEDAVKMGFATGPEEEDSGAAKSKSRMRMAMQKLAKPVMRQEGATAQEIADAVARKVLAAMQNKAGADGERESRNQGQGQSQSRTEAENKAEEMNTGKNKMQNFLDALCAQKGTKNA